MVSPYFFFIVFLKLNILCCYFLWFFLKNKCSPLKLGSFYSYSLGFLTFPNEICSVFRGWNYSNTKLLAISNGLFSWGLLCIECTVLFLVYVLHRLEAAFFVDQLLKHVWLKCVGVLLKVMIRVEFLLLD